jgi:hypothetical protein
LSSRDTEGIDELRQCLEQVVELLQLPLDELTKRDDELVGAVTSLPDELAIQAIQTFFRRDRWFLEKKLGPRLLKVLFDLDLEAVIRFFQYLFDESDHTLFALDASAWLFRCDPERRRQLCLDLLSLRGSSEHFELVGADVIRNLWPVKADPQPILEVLLDLPLEQAEAALDQVGPDKTTRPKGFYGLAEMIAKDRLDLEPRLDLLIRVHEAGYPGPWCPLEKTLSDWLTRRRDPRVRALAERLLFASEKPSIWALSYLLGSGHDPERDAPPMELLRLALGDPRLRPLVFESEELLLPLLPEARAELMAGSLTPAEAKKVRNVTWSLWRDDAKATERREELAAQIAPTELPGHLVPEEWVIMRRALREGAAASGCYHPLDYSYLPPLPQWGDDDRALFQEILDHWRHRMSDRDAHQFEVNILFTAGSLDRHPRSEDELLPGFVELVDEILIRDRQRKRSYFSELGSEARQTLRKVLGLDPDEPLTEAKVGSSWLDEDEDEE